VIFHTLVTRADPSLAQLLDFTEISRFLVWVRFPSPAPLYITEASLRLSTQAVITVRVVRALVSPAPDCLATTVRFLPPAGLDEPMAEALHELTIKRAIYSSSSS
jgi:hypothetical protein